MSDNKYTKEEFYKSFIQMQKLSGQGTSGIVKVAGGSEITQYLNEFIEEGLCIAENIGGSLGHPESNIFYMPSKGYNVWKEKKNMTALECVRYYLANINGTEYKGNPLFGITADEFKEGGIIYDYYQDWLQRNSEALDEMMNLSDVYPV